jgi:histidine triad (HIT) family protein
MYNHAPENYQSPFQRLIKRDDVHEILSNVEDVVYEDGEVTAFICSRSEEKNQGNVLVVPNEPFENIYDIPDEMLAKIHILSKQISLAMKEAYGCDGVSLRQHNEPAGNQEVWHYHLHIIPRYIGDDLYINYEHCLQSDPATRAKYAAKLRAHLNQK